MGNVITIDGPAGSGKSSVAKSVARILGYTHFDSGAIYRAIALFYLRKELTTISQWEESINDVPLTVSTRDGKTSVSLNGVCVDVEIRSGEVSNLVSPVSNAISVRKRVNREAVYFGERANLVADGRDMGTVVFPNAALKIYLDADVTVRAQRRLKDFLAANRNVTLEEVISEQEIRDENDRTKPWGALRVAEGAIVIDSTAKTEEEVTNSVLKHAADRFPSISK